MTGDLLGLNLKKSPVVYSKRRDSSGTWIPEKHASEYPASAPELVAFILRPSLSGPEAARTWQKPLAVLPGIGRGSRRVA